MYSLLTGNIQTGTFYVNYLSPLHHPSELEITLTLAPKNKGSKLNLETAVQDNKVMQDFELESLRMGTDHSQMVKATPTGSDYGSKDCVNLLSSTAVSRLNQGIIVMIRDVSEIHRLQVIAARTDRMKVLGEMAAQVAHEIRNPLGGIKGFAALLKRDLADHPELQKMADHIIDGTDSLNNLVEQILHYSRPVHHHPENTDLIELLQQVKQLVLADANIYKPDIAILIHSPFKELILSLDSSHFKSAILNLIVNAIQAMPKGGTITLSIEKQPGWIILKVADTGIGIAEEMLPQLYSPYFTTKPTGNGLGLVEVQKVIQAHGGTIDVSTVLNEGTTFTIKLPVQDNTKRYECL